MKLKKQGKLFILNKLNDLSYASLIKERKL